MSRTLRVVLFIIMSQSVAGWAQDNCKSDLDKAVKDCHDGIAKVISSPSFSLSNGTNEQGSGMAQAAYKTLNGIGLAMNDCNRIHQINCENACQSAMKRASALRKTELIKEIEKNKNACRTEIKKETDKGLDAQEQYAAIADGANKTADTGCADGSTCGTKDPNIQQARSSAEEHRIFWQKPDGTSGSYLLNLTPEDINRIKLNSDGIITQIIPTGR